VSCLHKEEDGLTVEPMRTVNPVLSQTSHADKLKNITHFFKIHVAQRGYNWAGGFLWSPYATGSSRFSYTT
jgi:hypothetical protein